MKYNALFIRAIALMQQHDSEHAAEQLFNALFLPRVPPVAEKRDPYVLLIEARRRSNCLYLCGSQIRDINAEVGTPYMGWNRAVAWIKTARGTLGCGLKEAKDLHDFVSDYPEVSKA